MDLKQFARLTKVISTSIANQKNDLLLLGAKDLEGRMKFRIFNKGQNSGGTPIGKYKSKFWMKVRRQGYPKGGFNAIGRQISKVDLEYTGELRNSIQVVKDSDGVALAIINDHNFDKAKGQELIQGRKEGQSKMEIFDPTQKEIKGVQNYIDDLIEEKVKQILSKFTS